MATERKPMLPDRVDFKSPSGREETLVKKKLTTEVLYGLSPKTLYRSIRDQGVYFGKLGKPREIAELFSDSVSQETLSSPKNKPILEQHKNFLAIRNAFLEMLAPLVTDCIFNKSHSSGEDIPFVVVPDNLFLRCSISTETGNAGESNHLPFVLSRQIVGFDEFLSRATFVQNKQKPGDHASDRIIEFKKADLQLLDPETEKAVALSIEQARVLGKLYGIALLIGHWDILNNINLSNSGAMRDKSGNLIPVIVDWGNCLGVGFKNLLQGQNAFQNPDISHRANQDVNARGINGFEHAVPFDGIVYPLLPRQLVKDLFDMPGSDPISQALFEGLELAYEQARKASAGLDSLIRGAVTQALYEHTHFADAEYVSCELLTKFYLSDQKSDYTLAHIIQERICSLGEIVSQLKKGVPIQDIAKETLAKIINSQMTPEELKESSILKKRLGLFESVNGAPQSSLGSPINTGITNHRA